MFTVNSLHVWCIQMQFSLYVNLHYQTYGILTVMTFEPARVSDFSQHVIFAVKWHRICDLGYAIFHSEPFQSEDISVLAISVRLPLWNLAEILHMFTF